MSFGDVVIRLLALGALGVWSTAAWADDAVRVEWSGSGMAGRDKSQFVVHFDEDLKNARLTLKGQGKTVVDETVKSPKAGTNRKFTWPMAKGEVEYTGTLEVTFPSGNTGKLPLQFAITGTAALDLRVLKETLDLKGGRITVTASEPVAKIETTVTADTGVVLYDKEQVFDGAKPGSKLEVKWQASDPNASIVKISLKVHDTTGYWRVLDLFPWAVEIPHEEVLFASGSSNIEAAEQPKLDATCGLLNDAVEKYGQFVQVNLYVGGHTDTVGPAGDNQALSLARARAIAQYLRKKCFSYPVFYHGYGESNLLVSTPDNTDEPKNRRAEYIIAAEPPHGVAWTPLK